MRPLAALLLLALLTPLALASDPPANQSWRYVGPGDATHMRGTFPYMVGGQDFLAPPGATRAIVRIDDVSGFPQSVVACEELDGSCVRRVEFSDQVYRGCAVIEVPLVTENALLHVHVVSNAGAAARGFGCGATVPGPTAGRIDVSFS